MSSDVHSSRIEPRLPCRRECGRSYRATRSRSGNSIQPMAPVQHLSVARFKLTVTNWHSEADVITGCRHRRGLRLNKHEPITASSSHPHIKRYHSTDSTPSTNSSCRDHTPGQEVRNLHNAFLLDSSFESRCLGHVRLTLGQITGADKASTLEGSKSGDLMYCYIQLCVPDY